MDNKLSELSKPVGFIEQSGMDYLRSGEDADIWPDGGRGDDIPLYSQEYVSALLAELEATRKQSQELAKQCGRLGARAAIAERKLATPVRLPVVLMGYQSDDYRIGFMEGVEKSGDEVRAAGFTVEGDE
ncbi:hypothetical protein [Serratia marcescens]|uniref:hypothetical protein n=1 Tax=Serratia marcescens TaxID=615 RepID=UPI0032047C51